MLNKLFILCLLCLFACTTENKIEIVFGGDVMMDRGIRKEIKKKGLPYLLEDIGPIFQSADYGVVNLECPIDSVSSPLTKQFVFIGDPETLPILHEHGITHCIMANNHSYDHGRETMIRTAAHLQENHIAPIGYGKTQQEACDPVIIQKNNIRVAIFASVTLRLESWMYLDNLPGMCQSTIEDLSESIQIFKKNNPGTTVIVTLHWGAEYQAQPSSIQRRQAKSLIEAGADAIIGHHPHVVQSYESIMDKPVFYSIGNLIFDNQNSLTHDGILTKIEINENGLVDTEIIPYHSDHMKPMIMLDEQKLQFMNAFQKRSDLLPE